MLLAWLDRLVAIREKQPFRAAVCLGIVAFTGIVRFLLEWMIGHRPLLFLNESIVGFVSYYLLVLLLYTVPLALLVRAPWRRSANVVLAAVFCGILPPLIDGLVSGIGAFEYEYDFDFPVGWTWSLHRPADGVPIGETVVLWLTISLTGWYVWRRTASAARVVAALAMAYAVVAIHGAIVPTLVARVEPGTGWTAAPGHAMAYGQLVAATIVYAALQRRVAAGLLARAHHTAPFVLVCLLGAALRGPIDAVVLWHTLLLWFAFLVALAQNDLHDRDEDARQGRAAYLDAEDVTLLEAILLLCVATLLSRNDVTGYVLLLLFVVSVLYSHPMYRAKRWFPANLKIEGVWGACAFLVGTIAAIDRRTPVAQDNLSLSGEALAHSAQVAAAFDASTLTALALVFGGWSLVAALKDYKDVRPDARAGVQTLYTLAARRAWGVRRVHRALSASVALAMLVPFALLGWARDWPATLALAGVPFGAALLATTSRAPSRAGFRSTLLVIDALLLALLGALLVMG